MSGNLAEFLKVLTIVVSWSTLILAGRHYMLSIDSSNEEEKESIEEQEEKRKAAYAPPTGEKHARLNQLRSEMQAMPRSDLISHISKALRENERDTIEAISLYPFNNSICPETYYWQAQRAHEQNHMGEDAGVLHDLKLCVPQLARAADSFNRHANAYGGGYSDDSKNAFDAAMSADFEAIDEVTDE